MLKDSHVDTISNATAPVIRLSDAIFIHMNDKLKKVYNFI